MHSQFLNEWATNDLLGKTNPLKPLEATMAEIKAIADPESNVNSAVSDADKCCKNQNWEPIG